MDDKIILERLLQKDETVLDVIMQEYNKLLWVIIGGVLGKAGTAEDIEECISDIYVRLWQKPDAFDPARGSLKIFLAVMAKSMAINMYTKLTKQKKHELDENVADNDDFIEKVFTREMSKRIYIAICAMNEPDKEILIRRLFLDQKPASIAANMNLSVKEVDNRLYQKKRKLRQLLEEGL